MKNITILKTLPLFFFILSATISQGQMVEGTDTLYGNEWINFQQEYFKINITEDGVYRLDYQTMSNAGVFSGASVPQGADFQLYYLGKEVPIFVTNSGTLGLGDHISFYGKKNRGEIDKYIYQKPEYQINPYYSLFTDTSAYFLTWSIGSHARIDTVANNITNPPTKENYCFNTRVFEYHNTHSLGKAYGGSTDVSGIYDLGEGYCRATFAATQPVSFFLAEVNSTGPNTTISPTIYTKAGTHKIELSVNNTTYLTDSFNSWAVKSYDIQVPTNTLNNPNTLTIKGVASSDDKFHISNFVVTYPRNFNFGNQDYLEFTLPTNNQSQYLEIFNVNHGGQAPILFDLTNNKRIATTLNNSGTLVQVLLPPSTADRQLVLVAAGAFKTATQITQYNFVDYGSTNIDYLLLSHASLFDDGNGNNYVQNYANYRASTQGGGYTTQVIDIDQVYHQFGYGITRHEQAIRNFVNWSVKNRQAQFLFILGKGVYYKNTRTNLADWNDVSLVPSFGFPSSDNLFGTDNSSNITKLAIGRIAAYTPDMVRQYLDKVQEMETTIQTAPQTIEDKAWMKNILHLGGGDPNIQNFIRNRLEEIGDTISQGTYGANVFGLYKHSTNVIQTATTDDVVNFINNGVGLITFFGHSAPNTLDFDIGEPTQYQNQGRYPMIYAMGCNTNRLFESRTTLSEKYVFVEERGAVGFIGSTATTSLTNLNIYGRLLYQKLANEMYGATIGEVMRSVIQDYPLSGYWGELVQNNIMLHGDPAIKIYPQLGADFIVNKDKSSINPSFVNVQADSFNIKLVVTNLGTTIEDSLDVLIEQVYPNGERVIVKNLSVPSPSYEIVIDTWIPLLNKEILGENKLIITLDGSGEIQELPSDAEFNNIAELSFQVISNNAFPVYPSEFSIVSNTNTPLKASTANAFSESVNYYVEIDTSFNFDSPSKQQGIIPSNGGLIKWSPTLSWQDSTVYYWRVSLDSAYTNGNGFDWKNSSFIYIDGSSDGWSQATNNQIASHSEAYLNINNFISFNTTQHQYTVNIGPSPPMSFGTGGIFIDGFNAFQPAPCPTGLRETVTVFVFDSVTLDVKWNPSNGIASSPNCWNLPIPVFLFDVSTTAERAKLINFINNDIQPNEYVVLYTTQRQNFNYFADQWAADSISLGTNIFQTLENQGASIVRNVQNNQTQYVFIFKKDKPNWTGLREEHAPTLNDVVTVSTEFTEKQNAGYLTSLPIGPSTSWQSLHWKLTQVESHDQASVDIIGVTQSGEDSLLITGIQANDTTLAGIDAAIFPYLKLRLNLKDSVNRTAPQLDYWRVLYDPVPELALTPSQKFSFHADTLQQGDRLVFELAAENISEQNMDSVLVKYSITNEFNQEQVFYKRFKPVNGGDTLNTHFTVGTRDMRNTNLLKIEVNPNNDQPEQFHFNNIGIKEFYVEGDKRNPLLDVTFDGAHIMNGDIVAAKPEIVITLKDENQYIALDDTSLFRLFVKYPSGIVKRFYLDGQNLLFLPADNTSLEEKNEAKIEWRPTFSEDGEYQLQVQARDAANNESGDVDYTVTFEIINEAKITNVLNYPNPFTTSTQFVFTLTGDRVPDNMRIQIMTVSGQVVREITMEELGPIRVGNNRTDYRWDGTDQYGDKLANGVYIYHVIATKDGEELELRDNGTFHFFKSNLGKMVILR